LRHRREGTFKMEIEDPVVGERRQWNDYRTATYHLSDIGDVHWSQVSGGVRASAPRPFLHGYVQCDAMIEGELAHSCQHGRGPHTVKVCIVKKGNEAVFSLLLAKVAVKPAPRE
jgi:hypothetical protein